MRVRRLRPPVRELVGQEEALARAHVGQALQLPRARLRQVLHPPVLAPEAHEGARRGRRRVAEVRQRRRRLFLRGQRQRHGRSGQPPGTSTSPATSDDPAPAPPPDDNRQTREPQRQIPQPARPEKLRAPPSAAAPQPASFDQHWR